MKATGLLLAAVFSAAMATTAQAQTRPVDAGKPEIIRAGSRASVKGPADRFTGSVRVDPLFDATVPGRVSAGSVTFEPGARSNWHTHPLGQFLVITAGLGWTQSEGGPIQEMWPGDVVWCPPGVRHWHGASPTRSVTHIAIQEAAEGTNVVWLEPVTDAQYHAARPDAVNWPGE